MRHIVILGGQAYQDENPLPEKTEGMEFWAQNPIEQYIRPKVSRASYEMGQADKWALTNQTNNVAMLAEVVDRWYEIHKLELTAERHPKHLEWLCESGIPIWVQDKEGWRYKPMISFKVVDPNMHTYPIEEVQALAPHANYLGSTFSYMVAHAVLEGVDKISFHWMARAVMRASREPRDGQSSLDYWLGLAEGRGIEIETGDLWLLKSWWGGRYGYDGQPPEWHRDDAERKYDKYLYEGREHEYK